MEGGLDFFFRPLRGRERQDSDTVNRVKGMYCVAYIFVATGAKK